MDYAAHPPSSDELATMARHVFYEKVMLRFSLQWCFNERYDVLHWVGTEAKRDDAIMRSNAYFESATVHARNLVHFYLESPGKNGITACHYVPDWTPDVQVVNELGSAMRPLSERVFHITPYRERVVTGTEDRDLIKVTILLDMLWKSFYKELSAGQRDWFDGAPD
jgi:hypothetical protein